MIRARFRRASRLADQRGRGRGVPRDDCRRVDAGRRGIDAPITDEGLGLWPEAIVSPHFSERRRLNGLIAIVKQHPALMGVGIDEGTAAIVSSGEITVIAAGA